VISQFLKNPINMDGKKASELLSKRRRHRRRRSPSQDTVGDEVKKKREKKKKEKQEYKSAELIADSDMEDDDLEAFLEKEKVLRDRVARDTTEGGRLGTMKATGTKKRRKKLADTVGKKRKGNDKSVLLRGEDKDQSEDSDLDLFGSRESSPAVVEREHPRPRPRPRPKEALNPQSPLSTGPSAASGEIRRAANLVSVNPSPVDLPLVKRKGRLVISDSEE
jgi:replication fork protection complex subunit Tof1/Swi1